MPTLFDPIKIGDIDAKNRIFMAPLTRARADKSGVPTSIMAEYYAQRATAGLIISEATGISRAGLGWIYAPGIWSQAQVEGWKPITQAVHNKGGKIVCQLWHMGRLVHSSTTGQPPLAPSAIKAPGEIHTYDGKKPYETPKTMTLDEIRQTIDDYRVAARHAIQAGFDGVQIHAANGYLIDEFLRDGTNHRSDQYGGSVENRLRLLQEVTHVVIDEIGASKVGVRLSPNGEAQGTIDSHPDKIFIPAAFLLEEMGIAWLGLREARPDSTFAIGARTKQKALSPRIREVFTRPLILNEQYSRQEAMDAVAHKKADAISFGRDFISNPDLVRRLKEDIPCAPSDSKSWYSHTAGKGYTDYPFAP